ncbi:trypsin-like peptidase domain-containing protein [Streptomyces sp. NPDC048825]|uniref:trypsin-like peptidase domain-containing protein n=1 Tax=Streptomyces sp. NPDC048825 TaxID=3365592 RepID=UPI003723D01F
MTANADRGLRPERVAEIIVAPHGGGAGRRGSGYLVSPGKVLTAAHVVMGAAGVRVRFQADRPGERIVEAGVVWRHEGIDVAVLALPDGDDTDVDRVAYGRRRSGRGPALHGSRLPAFQTPYGRGWFTLPRRRARACHLRGPVQPARGHPRSRCHLASTRRPGS